MEPLAFGWGSETKKWQIEANTWHDFGQENQMVQTRIKDLKEELMIWRTKMQVMGPR